MTFASMADRNAIENEMVWEDRNLPHSVWAQLSQTAATHGSRNAVTFQMFSGDKDPFETLTWTQLQGKVAQTANLFRDLGIGSGDVVAFLLPNAMETVLSYLGGAVAGIVNPINPLLDADQIGAILRETNAKVLVTLKAFPKTDVAQKAADAVDLAPNVKTVVEVDLLRYITGI
jgi:fatty-acyl-CoA synthase